MYTNFGETHITGIWAAKDLSHLVLRGVGASSGRANKIDHYHSARNAKDKKQMAISKRTERWTDQEASCEQVMIILHAKSPIVHLGHLEIK